MDRALGNLTDFQIKDLELKKTQNMSFDSLKSY